ncbi:MAG: thioredoxin domain-containing protein [Opitutae bacterium]|nr:thioredoxin domain-containing protein [Opitutae bacterium]MBT6957059.1 thioredoxin domain-containing protein [Opitutae bacterium]
MKLFVRNCLFGAVWFFLSIVSTQSAEKSNHHHRKPVPSPEVIAKLPKDGGPNYNRLVFEKSPYLLQHAGNPVDWYPWGNEAFAAARKQDKPVFLSIGYTTCHWCHVMERESFEDEEIGKLMSEHFICIKVDREERPDIDAVYMTVTQQMTGSGGWPMTVVMTPEKRPYFAGTYFPKESRLGRPGLKQLIFGLSGAWKDDRDKVLEVAGEVTRLLKQASVGTPGDSLTADLLDKAFEQLEGRYDPVHGGFGSNPKFPTSHQLSFLVRYWKRSGNPKALEMVERTIQRIRLGGIYDHVGLGVHRYSTDRVWLLPHFEKMLYDQAILAQAILDAYQATGKAEYADLVRELFTYVLRDMTAPEGGFYSAEDADSEGEEGKFYVWMFKEVIQVLGKERGLRFCNIYNILDEGNFRDEASGIASEDNIPHLRKSLPEIAKDLNLKSSKLAEELEADRRKLFTVREKRIHPQKDDKVLTDWNGLMIAAMARAGTILGEDRYIRAAKRAADFSLQTLRRKDGRLLKRYRAGEAGLPAHIEDYAFLTWGLLNLYEATFNVSYLQEAISLNDLTLKHFWDSKDGGFFMTADDGEKLLVRHKEIYDGAIPSGNSVTALNLLRIGRITGRIELEEKAAGVMKAFSLDVQRNPSAYTQLMQALDFAVGPSLEIVIAGDLNIPQTQNLLKILHKDFIPNKVILHRPSEADASIIKIAPYTEFQAPTKDGIPQVFVCQNYQCKRPVSKAIDLVKLLEEPFESKP